MNAAGGTAPARARFGAWPPLVLGAFAFAIAFAWLRSGSAVLAIEREAPALRALARVHRLPPAVVLALREQSIELEAAAFEQRVAAFVECARELGEPLAAVAVLGDADAARRALTAGGGDVRQAWAAFAPQPAALPGVRFLSLRERFAARASGRDDD